MPDGDGGIGGEHRDRRVAGTGRRVVGLPGVSRRATTLAGKIAERFLEVAPTEDEQGQQLLMAKATGNFKRGNERKR